MTGPKSDWMRYDEIARSELHMADLALNQRSKNEHWRNGALWSIAKELAEIRGAIREIWDPPHAALLADALLAEAGDFQREAAAAVLEFPEDCDPAWDQTRGVYICRRCELRRGTGPKPEWGWVWRDGHSQGNPVTDIYPVAPNGRCPGHKPANPKPPRST